MGSRRSGGSLFDGSVACCGRCLHLDERSGSVVGRSIRYVLLRVRCSFAYDETKAGHTSGWRTDRRFRSTGTWWRGLGAGRMLTCRRGHFSRMATTYGGTRQGRALSVCVFHADFRRATLHVCTVHRHADPGLDARTLVLSVLYWGCVYRRRNCNSERNTSASRSRVVRPNVFFWTVLLHATRVFAHIHNKDELTSLLVALAMSGGSFIVAGAVSKSR
jgi:hypothetical protein